MSLFAAVAAVLVAQAPAVPPPAWRCDPVLYDARDGCDCGCGAVDPDCPADAAPADCFLNHCGLVDAPDPTNPQVPNPADVSACVDNICGDGTASFGRVTNGVPADTEACDDGNNADDDGCSADCARIGDNVICSAAGQLASLGCWITACGDGKRDVFPSPGQQSEDCDDGNNDDGDGCSGGCAIEPGFACRINNTVCERTVCGDGRTDFENGEACDDGDVDDGDGCSSACAVEGGFDCDWLSSTYRPSTCAPVVCGDEIIERPAEQCDDGNSDDNDGCSAACVREVGFVCDTDDGRVGPAAFDPDDDRQGPSVCRVVICGDGVKDDSEICEDGNDDDGDGCGADCFIEAGFDCVLDDDGLSICFDITGEGEGEGEEGEGEGEEGEGEGGEEGEGEGEVPDNVTVDDGCACQSIEPAGAGLVAAVLLARRRTRPARR
jgi:cysteine-rich repeat protein